MNIFVDFKIKFRVLLVILINQSNYRTILIMEEGLAAGRNLKELLGNPKIIFVLGK